MGLGRWIAAAAMLLPFGAWAQQPSPAQMGITPTTDPEVLQTLDHTKTWVPIGTVDAATHSFTVVGGTSGGGGSATFGAPFPTTGTAIGSEYLSSPPTLFSGQLAPPQLNINGAMRVDGSAVSQPVIGVFFQTTQPISAATLPLPTGAAISVNQPTNASIGSVTAGQTGNLHLGAVTTGQPTYTTGQSDPLSLTLFGGLRTDQSSWGGGTITSTPTAVGVAGTGNTPTVNAYIVGGGASGGTSSNFGATFPTTGTAAGGQYLSSPPTLTNGNMGALQLDVNGNLKVTGISGGPGGGTSSNFVSAFPAAGTAIGLTDGTNMIPWSAASNYGTSPGAVHVPAVNAAVTNFPADTGINATGTVSVADTASTTTAGQNGQSLITGTPTTGSVLSFSGNSGFQTGWLQCTGTFSSSDVFAIETSGDGINWVSTSAYLAGAPQTATSTFSLPFTKAMVNLADAQYLRVRATAWTSGSPTCTLRVTANLQAIHVTGTSSTATNGAATAAASTLAGTVGSGAAGIGVQNPLVQADSSAVISMSTATSTQLVAGTASKSIRVTSWNVIAGGTGNFTLGTAASGGCASPTALTGAYPLTAQAGIATGSGLGALYTLPAGNDLCGTDSATVQMSGSVSYLKY